MEEVLAVQTPNQDLLLQQPPRLFEVKLDICNQSHSQRVKAHVGGNFQLHQFTSSNVYLIYIYIYTTMSAVQNKA
ncbi:hypothetical protein ACOSQ2_027332 [Xanthoceras sorbifolium]